MLKYWPIILFTSHLAYIDKYFFDYQFWYWTVFLWSTDFLFFYRDESAPWWTKGTPYTVPGYLHYLVDGQGLTPLISKYFVKKRGNLLIRGKLFNIKIDSQRSICLCMQDVMWTILLVNILATSCIHRQILLWLSILILNSFPLINRFPLFLTKYLEIRGVRPCPSTR
jgi:hypothetical protein